MTMKLREATLEDCVKIAEIYRYYVLETDITFDTTPPTAQEKQQQMQQIKALSPYLVAELNGEVMGYAYAKPWHVMPAYAHTYESTIYLAHDRDLAATKGLGTQLYQALIEGLKADGKAHVLFGVPTVGNVASEKLHEKLGFTKAATFREVGRKFDRWLDIDYYALYL